jgi:hypothetical protein
MKTVNLMQFCEIRFASLIPVPFIMQTHVILNIWFTHLNIYLTVQQDLPAAVCSSRAQMLSLHPSPVVHQEHFVAD